VERGVHGANRCLNRVGALDGRKELDIEAKMRGEKPAEAAPTA
jgi:hypothetical protein